MLGVSLAIAYACNGDAPATPNDSVALTMVTCTVESVVPLDTTARRRFRVVQTCRAGSRTRADTQTVGDPR